MRSGQPDVLEPTQFIVKTFNNNNDQIINSTNKVMVGIDASYITTSVALGMINAFKNTNIELIANKWNIIDTVWKTSADYPQEEMQMCVEHPIEFAGVSHVDKIKALRVLLHENKCYGTIITMLDEVSYVYNEYNRV